MPAPGSFHDVEKPVQPTAFHARSLPALRLVELDRPVRVGGATPGLQAEGPDSSRDGASRQRRALPIGVHPPDEHVRYQRVVRPAATGAATAGQPDEKEEVLVVNTGSYEAARLLAQPRAASIAMAKAQTRPRPGWPPAAPAL